MTEKSNTFTLFLISGVILLATIMTSTFWDTLGLGENKIPLAVSTTIAFEISIAGLVIGFGEKNKLRTPKFWGGLIGHFIVAGVFLLTAIYAML